MSRIALCADAESVARPEMVGLDGEALGAAEWLAVFSEPALARDGISRADDIDEVWVVSCDGMEPINLAAALKGDCADRRVFLVTDAATGSCLSRAQSAGLSGTLTSEGFSRRYASEKRKRLGAAGFASNGAALRESKVLLADDVDEEDFLPMPAQPGRPTVPRPAFGDGALPRAQGLAEEMGRAAVVTVSSAGGGAGKSAFAVIAACLLAERGLKTVLLDGDFTCADAAALSGEHQPVTFDGLAEGVPEGALLPNANGYAVVAAPERIEVGEALREALPQRLAALSHRFDAVVVNADAAWDERKVALLECSTHTVCLVDQRMSSVRLAQRISSLCERCGVASSAVTFALNRCSKDAPFSSIDVSCALQGRPVLELAEGGRIVEELLGVGQPTSLVEEGNAFCRSVEAALAQLLPDLMAERSANGAREARKAGRRTLFASGLFGAKPLMGKGGGAHGHGAS